MRGAVYGSELVSKGLMIVVVGGVFLGFYWKGGPKYLASYDRVKIHRKTPIDSMNCMSGPWNDCVADVKRAGWAKNYKARLHSTNRN